MDNDSRPIKWGSLCLLASRWRGLNREGKVIPLLWSALKPFVEYTLERERDDYVIPWRHRLHILFTGRLPDGF